METGASVPVPARNTVLWAAGLFALWVLLSGKLDLLHLGMGAVCAGGAALATRPLLGLSPAIGPGADAALPTATILRFLRFVPWLMRQILVSSVQVAVVVLHPRLPIAPRVLRVRAGLPHTLGRLTLANAVTLTPGTVTLDVEDDVLLVHALTETSARGLGDAAGDMPTRVRAIFAAREGGR